MSNKFTTVFLYIFVLFNIQLFSEVINIDKAVIDAENTRKNPLVYLHKTGCPYCERLEEFTLDDEYVENYIKKNFNLIVINVSHKEDVVIYNNKKTSAKEFAQNIGYSFYPSVLFFDDDGELEHGSVGYIEEKDFLAILKYIKTDAFKTMSLDEFKKKIGFIKESDNTKLDKRQRL